MKPNPHLKIYLDLDGVMFDFESKVKTLLGRDFPKWDNSIWQELGKYPNLFKDLDLMPDALELFSYLETHYKGRVIVLTAVPKASNFPSDTAAEDKRKCVADKLSETVPVITCYAVQKQNYAMGPLSVLIDDNVKNIAQWSNRGGTGIFHASAKDTISCLEWFRENRPLMFK